MIMAELPAPNVQTVLSESLNVIDPFEFTEDERPPTLTSSPTHVVLKSQELQNISDVNLSQSLNTSQVDTSGLLLQHINTQREVRVFYFHIFYTVGNLLKGTVIINWYQGASDQSKPTSLHDES